MTNQKYTEPDLSEIKGAPYQTTPVSFFKKKLSDFFQNRKSAKTKPAAANNAENSIKSEPDLSGFKGPKVLN